MGRVCAPYGYLKGKDGVYASRTALWRSLGRVLTTIQLGTGMEG